MTRGMWCNQKRLWLLGEKLLLDGMMLLSAAGGLFLSADSAIPQRGLLLGAFGLGFVWAASIRYARLVEILLARFEYFRMYRGSRGAFTAELSFPGANSRVAKISLGHEDNIVIAKPLSRREFFRAFVAELPGRRLGAFLLLAVAVLALVMNSYKPTATPTPLPAPRVTVTATITSAPSITAESDPAAIPGPAATADSTVKPTDWITAIATALAALGTIAGSIGTLLAARAALLAVRLRPAATDTYPVLTAQQLLVALMANREGQMPSQPAATPAPTPPPDANAKTSGTPDAPDDPSA
ncbi:hypothetical protein [Nonomuraea wenchangensis]|nr:hypothetical protein [Nonomuraea wenchangensis]